MSLYWALWPELSSPGGRASCLLDHRLDWPTPPGVGGTTPALTPTLHSSSQAGALGSGHTPRHRESMLFLYCTDSPGSRCVERRGMQGRESLGLGSRPTLYSLDRGVIPIGQMRRYRWGSNIYSFNRH